MKLFGGVLVSVLTFGAMAAVAQEIDGSTVESYERSARAMAESLPQADREIFARGMMNIIVTQYPAAAGLEGLALMSIMPAAVDAAHITLDGVTLDEIMERGRSLGTPPTGQEAAAAPSSNPDKLACLSSTVIISDAKVQKGAYSTDLTVTIANGLSWAISGVRFDYSVSTPGRSVAWLEDDVSLAISGGIEPGEVRTVSTSLYGLSTEAIAPLQVSVSLGDVADQHKRLFVGTGRVMGWSDEPSDFACP